MSAQPDLFTPPPLDGLLARNSACSRLAKALLAKRGDWIDGHELARIGGFFAFRTRLSELRDAPWHLDVRNQTRHVKGEDGRHFIISEYRIP
jgi:hypothetical protein